MLIHMLSQQWFHVSELIHVFVASRWHTQCKTRIACICKFCWHWNMYVQGVPKHHNVCSHVCWFTESYNSQCVSHFAARFIDDRTNTSIVACIFCKLYNNANHSKHTCQTAGANWTLCYTVIQYFLFFWRMSPQAQRSLFNQKEIMWNMWSS